MKKLYIYSISLLLLSVSTHVQAQEDVTEETEAVKKAPKKKAAPQYPTYEVKGKVIEASTKAALGGVQIKALNNDRYSTMTEEDGTFTLKVPVFTTALYVYAPDFLSQQVAINKGHEMEIRLLSDNFATMYDKTTSITAQKEVKVSSTTALTTETNIQSQLGADVRTITRSGTPGIGSVMFIRGLNSINANAQPLIVIDGVPQDMQESRISLHSGDYNNLLLNINPQDIETIKVLKNATAIYGSKGGNGVIEITTKRAHSMATRIEANISAGVTLVPNTPDMMNAAQYRHYATELLGTVEDISTYSINKFNFLDDTPGNYYYNTYHNDYNWKDDIYKAALTQNYSINVQGGDNVGMYQLSLGYTDGKSTAKENGFNRLNIRFNTDIFIIDKLSTKFDISYTKVNRNVFDDGAPASFTEGTVTSPTFLSLIKSPLLNPYTWNHLSNKFSSTLSFADGVKDNGNSGGFLYAIDQFSLANPLAILEYGKGVNKNRAENTQFNALVAPSFKFNDYMRLSETFSYTLNRNSQRYYRPVYGVPTFMIKDLGSVENEGRSMFSKEISVMSDTRFDFNKQMGAHRLDAALGMRFLSYSFDYNYLRAQNAPGAGNDKAPNIAASWTYYNTDGADDKWKNITWYLNAAYNYQNRYFVEAAIAADASSRFGENAGTKMFGTHWGFFPSIQLGWVLTNENWFPKTNAVNFLRLNAGYDISGNDDINNYAARTSFSAVKYLYHQTGAQLNNIGNDEIKWEQTNKFNVGLQGYFLSNRLGLSVDFYWNKTNNLLTLKDFETPIAGIKQYWTNGGALKNRGYEVMLTGKPIVSKDWRLELGASVGHYSNKITKLPNDKKLYVDGVANAQGYTTSIYGDNNIATIVGQSAGVFYGYKTDGIFTNDDQAKAAGNGTYLYQEDNTNQKQYFKAGDVHFLDLNGDGKISEADKTIIGNPNPDIYGNMFADLSWKNLTLHIGINYSLGNDVYNYQRYILEGGNQFFNQTTAMSNAWRFENQNTSIPKLAYGDPMGNARFSDRWIEDGSYIRLKTVRLTYKLPLSLTWLQGLSVWAEANNLITITKYLGNDPEFSLANGTLYQGIDPGYTALGRTFSLGLKVNL